MKVIDSREPKLFDARPVRLIPCWIALAVLIVFGSLARCGFTEWDDPSTLARNPSFNPPNAASVLRYWREPHRGLYVPVTYTLWGLIAKISQGTLPNGVGSDLKASPFHTANVLLHLGSAWVAYLILRRLVKKPWPAALGAMLFALHPVQVEPVAWASGMKDVLCGFLVLVSVWQYVCFAGSGRTRYAWVATLAFAAAALSKPTAVTTPIIVFAIDRWILDRPLRRAVLLPLAWCAIALPIALIAGRVQQVGVHPATELWQRPLVALDAIAFYLRQLAWPAQLAVDYSRSPSRVLAGTLWPACLISLMVAALVVWQARRKRWILAAAMVFVAPLLLVLGLRPFMMQQTSTVADHYLYLAMFGVAVCAAMFLSHRGVRWHAAFVAVLVALGIRSHFQTQFWKDDESLNRHTLAVNPESFTAHINYAHDLEMKGEFEAELREDAAAVRCNPGFALARGNYAAMLATLGHLDEAEGQCGVLRGLIAGYSVAERRAFAPTFAFVGREMIWHHLPGRALPLLREALSIDPNCDGARIDLTDVRAKLDVGS